MPAPTLLDLKAFLNISSTRSDDELPAYLDAAVGIVEADLDAPLSVASRSETFPARPRLVLGRAPVLSVDSITVSTSLSALVAGTDALVDLDTGIITLQYPWSSWGTVTVAYTYGWTTLPAPISLAVLIVAGHLWETQRGSASLPTLGGDQTPAMTPGAGYAMPNRARELLAPYFRAPRS